jgi:hypothetical protein
LSGGGRDLGYSNWMATSTGGSWPNVLIHRHRPQAAVEEFNGSSTEPPLNWRTRPVAAVCPCGQPYIQMAVPRQTSDLPMPTIGIIEHGSPGWPQSRASAFTHNAAEIPAGGRLRTRTAYHFQLSPATPPAVVLLVIAAIHRDACEHRRVPADCPFSARRHVGNRACDWRAACLTDILRRARKGSIPRLVHAAKALLHVRIDFPCVGAAVAAPAWTGRPCS